MKKVILSSLILGILFLVGCNSNRNLMPKEILVESDSELKDFYMAQCEVTQELYQFITKGNPSVHKGRLFPVEKISFYDAIYFCNKLSLEYGYEPCYAINGETDVEKWNYTPNSSTELKNYKKLSCDFNANGYRIPTMAEWEYAAYGGKNKDNFAFAGSDEVDEVSWYKGNSSETKEVGLKKPNSLNLYDMSGNVWEWCWDNYRGLGDHRYYRGGSFKNGEYYSKIYERYDFFSASGRSESLGIRLVRSKTF